MFRIEEVKTHRRGFLGTMAAAAAAGLASLTPLRAEAEATPRRDSLGSAAADPSFEAWLNRITGRHKMVFDAPEVNGGMPVVWPRVWLNTTNDNYGTTDAQNSGVVILRHASIPLAMVDALWAKYKLGEVFSLKDGDLPATHNTFSPLSRVSVHTVPRSPARCTIRCGTPRSGTTVPAWNGAAFGKRPRRAAIQPP